MSCNVCHCPILVGNQFLNPAQPGSLTQTDHLQPVVAKVCPPRIHQKYYKKFVQMDRKFVGIVADGVEHAGRGLFFSSHWDIAGGMALVQPQEEIHDKKCRANLNVAHEGCLKLWCAYLGLPFDLSPNGTKTLIALVERQEMLGLTLFGGYEGIDYSEGDLEDRWMTEPYGCGEANEFCWEYKKGEEDWTMKRPDLFPRLYGEVKPDRLEMCAKAKAPEHPFSTYPDNIFLNIANLLPINDLYTMSTLNKDIRRRTLKSEAYQTLIRDRLKSFAWALPFESEIPEKAPDGYPVPTLTGDWLLYGYHIHKTNSIRNRRRIFNILAQMECRYLDSANDAGYLGGPFSEIMRVNLHAQVEQQLILARVVEIQGWDLLDHILAILNEAQESDLFWYGKFRGKGLPVAVATARAMMLVSPGVPQPLPSAAERRVLVERVNEHMAFNLEEKKKYPRERPAVSRGESMF